MAYPGTLDNFTPKVDNVDSIMAADINELQTAIEAIETELGTDPAGSAADLKTRLAKALSDAGDLEFAASTGLTIATGAITITQNFHRVDTEGAAASDDLDTINGLANDGMVLVLRAANDARTVIIKHGTGNIKCVGNADLSLDDAQDFALLVYDANLLAWMALGIGSASGLTGSGTAGQIPYFSGVSTLTGESGFEYDATNNKLTAGQFVSSVADGTAPITVTSETACPNLNADQVDGVHGSEVLRKLATVTGVDLNVTTKSTLYTVPTGKSFIPTHVVVREASTSLTTASYGFGFDTGATDVIADATHTELTGSTLYTILSAKAGAKLGAAADIFGVKCSVAQGAAATATIDVWGYLY